MGTKEAVAAAKDELESRIKDLDKIVEETMTVDPKHHRYFVARRGEVLRNIGDKFGGVVVSFPRPGVTSDKVHITNLTFHSTRNRLQIELKMLSRGPSQGEKVCIKGSEYVLFEIQD